MTSSLHYLFFSKIRSLVGQRVRIDTSNGLHVTGELSLMDRHNSAVYLRNGSILYDDDEDARYYFTHYQLPVSRVICVTQLSEADSNPPDHNHDPTETPN